MLDNDLPYTRTKVELDANAFKKACQSGEIEYLPGETVNMPTVAIGKLGHLLITQNSPFKDKEQEKNDDPFPKTCDS